MAKSKHIAGVGLSALGLLLGFVCIGRAAEAALDQPSEQLHKRDIVTAGLLLGIPCTTGAGWMLLDLEAGRRRDRSQRMQTLFYKAVRANDGRINPLQFAMLAEVSLSEAQRCLNDWAGPLNADFEVDEAGVVEYCFYL